MLKITEADLQLLSKHNLTEVDVNNQYNFVTKVNSLVELIKPCDLHDGIINLANYDKVELINNFLDLISKNKVKKFVPSSGASSRMFAFLIKSNNVLKIIFTNYYGVSKELHHINDEITTFFNKDFWDFKKFIKNLDKFLFFHYFPNEIKNLYYEKVDSFLELEYKNINSKLNEISLLIFITDYILYDKIDEAYFKSQNKFGNVDYLVLEKLINNKGLGYANLPKGVIPFHFNANAQNATNIVTAFEEHINENESLIMDNRIESENQSISLKIEFSINMDFLNNFQNLLDNLVHQNTKVEFSEQNKITNSLAFDENNNLVKDPNGELLLRAGGHGSLLYNIQNIKESYIFLRNIDNIPNFAYQKKFNDNVKLIIGFTNLIKKQIDEYLNLLENNSIIIDKLKEIEKFVNQNLFQDYLEKTQTIDTKLKLKLLIYILNRPFRVAAMVKNTGEPGGGPFFTNNSNNSKSPDNLNNSDNSEFDKIKQVFDSLNSKQIVELSQINKVKYSNIIKKSKYFNPVFMVINFTKYDNSKYNLEDYKDKNLGMVVKKDYNSKKIKSYEYPGLWNGSMSAWNTIFVDLGDDIFFPVKNVNDLLKKGHKG